MAAATPAKVEQQLSLVAALGLPAEPLAPDPDEQPAAGGQDHGAEDEESLAAEALARPRRRQVAAPAPGEATTPAEAEGGLPPAEEGGAAEDDQPRWHHHGLVDPASLTPMLRHYVELKAAHPERVLLYRLGDFFECFFEDAITLSRLLELTPVSYTHLTLPTNREV